MTADEYTTSEDLVLPEGYVAERYEDGRLRIYDTDTGGWLGEIAPHLANAQEVAQDLIASHEDSEAGRENLTVLGSDQNVLDRLDERRDGVREPREAYTASPSGDGRKDAALRVRELEVVARLTADSLERAGDAATAEVVRSALRDGSG